MTMQRIVSAWALDTFGPHTSERLRALMLKEVGELNEAIAFGRGPEAIEDELADIGLFLMQVADYYKIDLRQAEAKKHKKNTERRWKFDNQRRKIGG